MAEKLVHTGYGNGQSNFPIKLYVTYETSQDIAKNQSTITCGMYVTTPGSAWTIGTWTDYGPSYVGRSDLTFNGTIPNFGGTRTLVSGKKFTVDHNNDGTGSARIYWAWGVNSSWGGFVKPSGYFDIDLPTIPRDFSSTPTMELTSYTEETATFKWTAPETVSKVEYKINSNGSWIRVTDEANSKSGTFTVTGLEPNTSYTIYGDWMRKDSGRWSPTKGSVSIKTYDYPYCNVRPNYTLGEEVTLEFYNPLRRTFTFYIIAPDGTQISHSDYTISDTKYIGLASDASTDKLYKSVPNSDWGYYRVRTVWGKYDYTTPANHSKFYISKSKAGPTFPESNIIDVRDTLLVDSITGNSSKVIKGHNNITGTIKPMTANKHATGKRYVVTANASPGSQEITHDGSNKSFSFSNITTNSFSITAYDSRNFDVTRNKSITLIDYSTPKINSFKVLRQNGLGEYATLTAEGTYSNWTGWSEIKKYNSIQKVWYRFKKSKDSQFSMSWRNVPASLKINSDGNWKVELTMDDVFDLSSKYDFQFTVEDLLEETRVHSTVLSTANGFLWRDLKNKFLGINKKPEKTLDVGGTFHVDGKSTFNDTISFTHEGEMIRYPMESGYSTDKWGDLKHNRSNGGDWFGWRKNNGEPGLVYYWEETILEVPIFRLKGKSSLADYPTSITRVQEDNMSWTCIIYTSGKREAYGWKKFEDLAITQEEGAMFWQGANIIFPTDFFSSSPQVSSMVELPGGYGANYVAGEISHKAMNGWVYTSLSTTKSCFVQVHAIQHKDE
jgi:hypothetical protein